MIVEMIYVHRYRERLVFAEAATGGVLFFNKAAGQKETLGF